MRRLVIESATGRVVNVIVLEGEGDYTPPPGTELALSPDGVGIGHVREADGTFTAPPAPEASGGEGGL